MNGFRIAILSLMVLAVGILFYFVVEMLPNQQRVFDDYHRSKAIGALNADAEASGTYVADEKAAQELEKLRQESAQAVDRVHSNEEHRTVAQAEEVQRRESEKAMADQLARETAEASALGLVTEVALDAGFFSFKPLGNEPISEGLVIAVRRGDDDYVICEAIVSRYYEESGEYIADIKNDAFSSVATNSKGERPVPGKGDLIVVSPFATADQLRGSAPLEMDVPVAPAQ